MIDSIERQREHFDSIAARYFAARQHPNHVYLKKRMWRDFLGNRHELQGRRISVLEPMCGFVEGRAVLSSLALDFEYEGFDYASTVVERLRSLEPTLNVYAADVTTFETAKRFDVIILIGGLHHVPRAAQDVVQRLSRCLRPNGMFINFEPTSGNPIFTAARDLIYRKNSLFDEETERAFPVRNLFAMFEAAGLTLVDTMYSGLLSYVLYYNPDAFPALNVGGLRTVESVYWLDKLFIRSSIGRFLSFATMSAWRK